VRRSCNLRDHFLKCYLWDSRFVLFCFVLFCSVLFFFFFCFFFCLFVCLLLLLIACFFFTLLFIKNIAFFLYSFTNVFLPTVHTSCYVLDHLFFSFFFSEHFYFPIYFLFSIKVIILSVFIPTIYTSDCHVVASDRVPFVWHCCTATGNSHNFPLAFIFSIFYEINT
jgi:hypothetical protein